MSRRALAVAMAGVMTVSLISSCSGPVSVEAESNLAAMTVDRVAQMVEWKYYQNTEAEFVMRKMVISSLNDVRSVELPQEQSDSTIANEVDCHGDGTVTVTSYFYANVEGEFVRVDWTGQMMFCGGEVDMYDAMITSVKEAAIGGDKRS